MPQDMVFPLKLYLFYHPFKSYCPPWLGKPPPMDVYDDGFGHFFTQKGQNRFLAFFGLQRPEMTPTQKTQKNPIYKRFFLYILTFGHFWPLVAEKAKKPNSEISKKLVFGLFQPSEAKNDPDTENTKEPAL